MRPRWRGVLIASALAALGIGALASLGTAQWLTAMMLMTMELMAGSLRGAWHRSRPGMRAGPLPAPEVRPGPPRRVAVRLRFRFQFRRPAGGPGPRSRPRRVGRRGRGGGFASPA